MIEINNCGCLIRNIKKDGTQIIGEIETLSAFKGPDIANLISRDKVDIGFSLRALGSVKPLQDGTLKVNTPIHPITYDIVSSPSHTNARVLQFLPESDISLLEDAESIICENTEIPFLEKDHITLCEGNYCIKKFIDDVIAESFIDAICNKIKFRF